MGVAYEDIILLNAELKEKGLWYRAAYKDGKTVCVQPPGECCLTEEGKYKTEECIREYFGGKGKTVTFSEDGLYFSVSDRGQKR